MPEEKVAVTTVKWWNMLSVAERLRRLYLRSTGLYTLPTSLGNLKSLRLLEHEDDAGREREREAERERVGIIT